MTKECNDLTVTIPRPSTIGRARGLRATTSLGYPISTRFSELDYNLIKEEAEQLDIAPSMFVRWCALQVAAVLRRQRNGEVTHVDP